MKTFVLDQNYLAITGIVTIAMQLFFFAIAYTCQFDKVTDFAGTLNFIVLAVMTFLLNKTFFVRQVVVTVMVIVWGLRLGGFLVYRVFKRAKDARFDEMRSNFFKFLGFWIFQMFWALVVSLAVIFLNATTTDVKIGVADYIGWALWAFGFLLEALADQSKNSFSNDAGNRGMFINVGVWSVSRHPNYAGEIFLWTGIFITCAASFKDNTPAAFVSILSPIFTFAILMFLSGVNLAEERYNKAYGDRQDYFEYRQETSPLIPLPRCIYKRLPLSFKRLFCCEFTIYEMGLPATGVLDVDYSNMNATLSGDR
jgi:steroid 5-alpha reductase family enzyme